MEAQYSFILGFFILPYINIKNICLVLIYTFYPIMIFLLVKRNKSYHDFKYNDVISLWTDI